MEHIYESEGVFILDKYFAHLEKNKDAFPEHIYAFAANPAHYDLESHSSLHDAWLNSLTISEPAAGNRKEVRKIEILANFLGPFHDLEITLNYKDVIEFNLDTPSPSLKGEMASGFGHGDLLIHEVRLEEEFFVHELLFSRGSKFVIKCRDILHHEHAIETKR